MELRRLIELKNIENRMMKLCKIMFNITMLILIMKINIFSYDRISAFKYLTKYCTTYNVPVGQGGLNGPFYNFNIAGDWSGDTPGGDCANFVSQCLMAGNIIFDKSRFNINYWGKIDNHQVSDYNRTIAKTRPLREYLDSYFSVQTTFRRYDENIIYPDWIDIGDVITSHDHPDSWTHSMIVNRVSENMIYYSAHNADRYDSPLSRYSGTYDLYYSHLPDMPIAKYIKLYTDNKVLFEWSYDTDYTDSVNVDIENDEYYVHTYNGLTPGIINNSFNQSDSSIWFLGTDRVYITVLFDQSMRTNNNIVRIGTAENEYNEIYFRSNDSNHGWSDALYENDRWDGYAYINDAEQAFLLEGKKVYFAVDAYSALNGDQMDVDNKLDVYTQGLDTVTIKPFLVDNRIPFLQKISVFQDKNNDGDVNDDYETMLYCNLVYDGDDNVMKRDSNSDYYSVKSGTIIINLQFSESIAETSVFVIITDNTLFDTAVRLAVDTTYFYQDTYKFEYYVGDTMNNNEYDLLQICVSAQDIFGNKIDSNPYSIAMKNNNGVWQNYQAGTDKNHLLTFDNECADTITTFYFGKDYFSRKELLPYGSHVYNLPWWSTNRCIIGIDIDNWDEPSYIEFYISDDTGIDDNDTYVGNMFHQAGDMTDYRIIAFDSEDTVTYGLVEKGQYYVYVKYFDRAGNLTISNFQHLILENNYLFGYAKISDKTEELGDAITITNSDDLSRYQFVGSNFKLYDVTGQGNLDNSVDAGETKLLQGRCIHYSVS